MDIIPLSSKQDKYLKKYHLIRKFQKQINLLLSNPGHPSLNIEKLLPKNTGLYSFRIDKKFRAIFVTDNQVIKIVALTNHYS